MKAYPAIDVGPVRVLSDVPPVFLSGIPYDEYLGFAPAFADVYGDAPAAFLIFPTWSIETPGKAAAIRKAYLRHHARFPHHILRYLCNTEREAELLEEAGQPATFLNHKFFVSEQVFRPLPDVPVEFDALYNARFVPGKRHELTAEIEKVGYLTYLQAPSYARDFHELWAATQARNPKHALLNKMRGGLPLTGTHAQVNEALSRAAVGLLLSKVEGASYAAVEYMLAGMPVVSTRSVGGRDVYFDPDYCIVCDDDPRSVRQAVDALKARNLSREYVRERTLAKLAAPRRQFLEIVDDLREELGGERARHAEWPWGKISGIPWNKFQRHIADAETGQRTAFERRFDLNAGALADVQLRSNELRVIADTLRARPGASLLVFGCGHDSPIWEKINAGGRTAFIEDNLDWAEATRETLTTSPIHVVSYGTRLANWRRLLRKPSELELELPEEITAQDWDIVLVDGPAGHDNGSPGRMKSIHAASRLVAPGGVVLVHDCERPAEAAYVSRFLGHGELIVETKGRALLRGYRMPMERRDEPVQEADGPAGASVSASGREVAGLAGPRITFIVVNWNYARYLGETLESIRTQDYPDFDCVVVDNGSTDDSISVIEQFTSSDYRFQLVRLDRNAGQLGGVIEGLKHTDAPFVAIIDADDTIFPNFASIHLQTHLALPANVGVTTSGVIEIDHEGSVMSSRAVPFESDTKHAAALRNEHEAVRLTTITDEFYSDVLGRRVRMIPGKVNGWLWSPGTANVMRRSVMDLFLQPVPRELMRASDGLLLPLCHNFAGTGVIDIPLSLYRIHQSNYFATRENFDGLRRGNRAFARRYVDETYLNLETFLANTEQNSFLFGASYWSVVDRLARRTPRTLAEYYRSAAGVALFKRHAKAMRKALGARPYVTQIIARFGLRKGFRLIRASYGGKVPRRVMLTLPLVWARRRWAKIRGRA